ncbi:Nitrogen Permease regulator of amino acid transport activity 3 [Phytophthora infestans]|uniref:Nitrogen Permease regulator of amino acid transport activity 3 n=1 Tax=Phytophthora infestans TaxID=4787 RepID=A0A833SC40_PHYIN|nr:Nitrogen Permease regulator of amino acid transport activity 3 [Phytophthora infestans]
MNGSSVRLTGSCRLLGVALVVDDISKGCNLAFRYPAPPSERASSFHSLPAPLLAKLFRPKNALCNASFELVVDDLRFVSHPVLVSRRLPAAAPADGPGGGSSAQNSLTSATGASPTAVEQSTNNSTGAMGNETTMFNIIFALEDRPPQVSSTPDATDGSVDTQMLPLQQADEEELLARRRSSAQAFHTVAAQLANGLLHEELRVGFVSKEVRELLQLRDELAQSERNAGSNNAGVTSGNSLSAAVAAGATSGSSLTSNTGANTASSGSSLMHLHHHRKDGENGSSTVEVDPQTLIDVSLGKCVLANDLKRVFHGLEESGAAHVVLNGWVKLSLTLTDAVTVKMASLRPYHTLLLLADKDEILNKLPVDHARQLRDLVESVNPLKSFQDIALETGVPIHQVFRLAAHLVYWGFGRIVDAITLYNIYQVNAKADLHITSPLALEFRRKFAPYELGEVLSTFSGSRRIGEYMKTLSTAKKTEYVHMLIWLLQQRFIVQLHRFIYFMIPSDGDYAAELGNGASSVGSSSPALLVSSFRRQRVNSSATNTSAPGSLPIAQIPPMNPADMAPSPVPALLDDNPATDARGGSTVPMAQVMSVATQLLFTDQERAYLAKIAKPNPVFTLFKRLCVYFHGEHHIEEIMWRENLSRGELRTVMSTYQDIIVCCLHE